MKTVYIKRNDLFRNITMMRMNNINDIDEEFIDDNFELFYSECDNCEGSGEKNVPLEGDTDNTESCEECYGEGRHDCEPYQYFIADMSYGDKEYLESYGVDVGYSNVLDKHVIPIYDFGTSWTMFSYSKEVEDDYTLGQLETLERTTPY